MNRIKYLREDSDLTQAELTSILGYHTTTYARWEREEHNIKLCEAIIIAKFYNISLDYIAGITNIPKPLYKRKK